MSTVVFDQIRYQLMSLYVKRPSNQSVSDWQICPTLGSTVWVNTVTGQSVTLLHAGQGAASLAQQQVLSVLLMLAAWR